MRRIEFNVRGSWARNGWILICSCFFASAAYSFQVKYPSQHELDKLYDSLANPSLDDSRFSEISNVSITRGGQTITLKSGSVHFFTPVRGKPRGVVFTGSGDFLIHPLTEIEQKEFTRQTDFRLDSGYHSSPFERAVLWFTDSTFEELAAHCAFKEKSVRRPEHDALERSTKFAVNPGSTNTAYRMIEEIYEPQPEAYFFAHILLDKEANDLFLEYDLRRFEEVVIEQPYFGSSTGFNFWRIPVCSFHIPEEYKDLSEDDLTGENKSRFRNISNVLRMKFDGYTRVEGDATVTYEAVGDPSPCIQLSLYPTLGISEITDAKGTPLSFLRAEHSWPTLVFLPAPDSGRVSLDMKYDGELFQFARRVQVRRIVPDNTASGYFIDLHKDRMLLESTLGWYPHTGEYTPAAYDMTYTYPDRLELVSAGMKIDERKDGNDKIVHYATREASKIVSFSIGEFIATKAQLNSDEPVVTLYDVKGGDPEKVAVDLASSVHFFTYMFGRIPYKEVKAAVGSNGGGQAYPEFVVLPWVEEAVGDDKFSVSIERAHEISHAWWGHEVGWRSYHDQWLSEGFAEYSSLLYALYILKKDAPILAELKKWRESITNARKFAFGSGAAVGSIWLGYRSSSNKSFADVNLLVYAKGAFVLHMLRMMMMDLQTFKEDAFRAMMSDFYRSFNGLNPGTTDFEHIVEKYMKMDMRWFFREWVYRTDIPTYRIKSTVTKSDSSWKIALHVTQSGVPDTFKMYVPVQIRMKSGSSAYGRVLVDHATSDYNYEVAEEPEKVIFNPFEAVLCTVEEE